MPIFYITWRNRRGEIVTRRVRCDDAEAWIRRNKFKFWIDEVIEIKEG